MLVLTRKVGESIAIGSDVRITVVSLPNGQVRLAIQAPAEVPIHRGELLERIAEANRAAAQEPGPGRTGRSGCEPEEAACDPRT